MSAATATALDGKWFLGRLDTLPSKGRSVSGKPPRDASCRELPCPSPVGAGRGEPLSAAFLPEPRGSGLADTIVFPVQRVRQAKTLRQRDLFAPVCVADFLLEKDRIFAELTLNPDELELYYRVYELLAPRVPTPDLVIYLQAPVETLLERIEHRGIEYDLP